MAVPPKPIPNYLNFAFGGLSGMLANVIVHPFDVLKNNLQVAGMSGEKVSIGEVVRSIIKNQGITGLYNGLTAGLLRQATYTTTRLGVYNNLLDMASKEGPPVFAVKAMLGITAGAIGAFVGTPADVCLIRMTTDARLPVEQKRNYKNVIDALIRIVKEEGVTTLWRGCIPTVFRACVVNAAQLATYSQAKEMLIKRNFEEKSILTHFSAAMISGFFTAFSSNPLDTVKTRIQNMKTINGVPEYKGSLDAAVKLAGKEGILTFWKGFVPYYSRLGPHTVFTFIILEQLNATYRALT